MVPPLLFVIELDHLSRHLLRSSHVRRHHLLLGVGIHVVKPEGQEGGGSTGVGFWVWGWKGRGIGWSVGRLVGWSVGRLVGWSVGRLVGWSV